MLEVSQMDNGDNRTGESAAEIWLPAYGYESICEVSNHGRVRTLTRTVRQGHRPMTIKGRMKALVDNGHGRKRVYLHRNGRLERPQVHRLVLETFVGPCPPGMEACHNDGNPANNHVSNLRWDTGSSNMLDKRRHGTDHQVNKTHCPRGHELRGANLRAREGQLRGCKACNRASAKKSQDPQVDFDAYANMQYERLRPLVEEHN